MLTTDNLSDDEIKVVINHRIVLLQKHIADDETADVTSVRKGFRKSRGDRMKRALCNIDVFLNELARRVDEYDYQMTAPQEELDARVPAPKE